MSGDKTGGSGLSGSGGLIAVLVLAVGAFVLHEAPLQGTRPAANEPKIDQRFAEQDIDARLWQDPFGAVERAREELNKKSKPGDEAAQRAPASLKSAIVAKTEDGPGQSVTEVDVLAVMVPGGPYTEQVELRRRSRYAVLASLNAQGYMPVDTEHIGYFMPSDNERLPRDLPRSVPFEWFEPEPDGRAGACPPGKPNPAASAPGIAGTPSRCPLRHVLVLWLDGGAFAERPFERIARLFGQIVPDKPPLTLRWRVIGPTDSAGLRAMVEESSAASFDASFFQDCDVRFYSQTATVADAILLERVSGQTPATRAAEPKRSVRPCGRARDGGQRPAAEAPDDPSTLARHFAERGISFIRTIGSDQRLAESLMKELRLRLLTAQDGDTPVTGRCRDPGPGSPPHIAVISELDTLYGRSLRRQFRVDADGQKGFCVKTFHYVRGLDGQLPDRSAPAASGKDTPAKPGARDPDAALLIERAEGQSQYDYLRRLSARLREQDHELRIASDGKAGIRAIGVLGNDVHDKLLVLQALRPEFPDAVFFTTDLDVRLLHPREQAWTRNLVVASNFGLRLTDRLQSGTPPFRDSYQTSAFFASSLALAEINNAKPFRWTQAQLAQALQQPRVFEIGRTAAFDFSAPVAAAATPASGPEKTPAGTASPLARLTAGWVPAVRANPPAAQEDAPRCGLRNFGLCTDIHPPPSRAWPHINLPALSLMCALLVAMLWVPAFALSPPARQHVRRCFAEGKGWQRGVLLAVLLAVQVGLPLAMALSWPGFAAWLTRDGKPISFSEGISIWPTEAIRVLTLLLCVYLVFRAWSALVRNLDEITLALKLGVTRRTLVAEQTLQDQGLAWWQRLANIFVLQTPYVGPLAAGATRDPGMNDGAFAFWKRYIVQNRSVARVIRTIAWVLLMVLMGAALLSALDTAPGVPVRGDRSRLIHDLIGGSLYVAMAFLIFYVADATLLCVRFVRELRWRSGNWPELSTRWFESRLGKLPPELLDRWIDLQFIARRTRCVTRLVYYPFVVLSLLLLSRSEVFDNWRMPMALPVAVIFSVGIVLSCIVALRRAAENSRSEMLVEVKEAMLRAQARDAQGQPAPQQLDLLRRQVEELREGAFAPFAQQPLLKALLMPFATWGGTVMLDYMAMASI